MTFSQAAAELAPMVDELRRLHYRDRVEGMSIISGSGEWELEDNPFIQRYFQEFALSPMPQEDPDRTEWLLKAARRALLEERPKAVLVAKDSPLASPLKKWCRRLGIEHWSWPEPRPSAALAPERKPLPWAELLRPNLERLKACLPAGSYRFRGPTELKPFLSWLDLEGGDESPLLSLFELARAESPSAVLKESSWCLEAVNLPVQEGRRTFRYRDYDNEFALAAADCDLADLAGPDWQAEAISLRSGAAGEGPPEAPDGTPPLFLLSRDRKPGHWLDRFRLPGTTQLKVVFADSQNIAGSVLNHACAVNRHTRHQAWSLSTTRHPFIEYPQEECRIRILEGGRVEPELLTILEEADCFVFFEDDDETSSAWPIDLSPFVRGKKVVHLYIGWRVHRDVPGLQRPGRTVLTPLPHLMRMFPRSHFYAGFPPATLDDVPLEEPLSATDGIVRVLHTPSLPHRRLSRYYYHKDTEAFLTAARRLKARYGAGVEFWQVAGWPHRQILTARQQCDITFNQLRGYHGLSGDEAMYLRRPMIQAFDQSNVNRHREYWGLDAPFPWLTATRESLEECLDSLIENQELRRERGELGRNFMLEYFSPQMGIEPLLWHCHHAQVAE